MEAHNSLWGYLAADQWDGYFTPLYRTSRDFLFFLRNGFTAYNVISPENGSFASVAGGTLPAHLTPAPRRQDHTTSPYASCALVLCAIRVHRIPPRVRDDRDPPLVTGEMRGIRSVICPTAPARICPSGCFVAALILALRTSRRHSGARLGASPESI